MKKVHLARTMIAMVLALTVLGSSTPVCSAATSTSSQVVQNAQSLYDKIKDAHGGIKGYVQVLSMQKRSYQETLINAEYYNTVYDTIIDFGSTGMTLISSIIRGNALETVKDETVGLFLDQLTGELPKLTIEEYIYSQAKAGASQVNLTELMDIGFKIENECHGRVSSVEDAVRFIKVNQEIKIGFAALHMGRSLYYEQLNASPWDALVDMFTNHSLSYLGERFGGNVLEQYRRELTAEKMFELFEMVMNSIDNKHVTRYTESVIAISKETQALTTYEIDDFGKSPSEPPGVSAPEPPAGTAQTPAPSPPAVTHVSCHYKNGPYNEGMYVGEWSNGKPHGWGKLTYDGFEDGKFYSITGEDGTTRKAIFYEGNFVDGYRVGYGTVEYEGGYVEEGTFSGLWQAGKLIFEGKRWHVVDGQREGYRNITVRCVDGENASVDLGPLVSVKQTYSVTYHANGGQNAPSPDIKTKDIALTLSSQIPTYTGYTFLGWSASAGVASETYRPGDLFTDNADTTLYAVWQKLPDNPIDSNNPNHSGNQTDTNYPDYSSYPNGPNDAFSYSVPSQWARESVRRAYDKGLLPDEMQEDYLRAATRIDFVYLAYSVIEREYGPMRKLLYERGDIPNPYYVPELIFHDVPSNCGYDEYDGRRVAALNMLGIVKGVGGDRFEPFRTITREEAAAMLDRVYSFLRWGTATRNGIPADMYDFYDDDASISPWAVPNVYRLRSIGVMRGVGGNRFAPKDTHTIEESIVTFMRLIDYVS